MKVAPLTDRMWEVLKCLAPSPSRPRMTANEIARACGYYSGQPPGHHAHDGRAMAPAQRVIFSLIGLRNRGLIRMANRRDHLTGTAYEITDAGVKYIGDYA